MTTATARILGPTDGATGRLGGVGVRFMVDGTDSGGGFSLVEHPMEPHALAAPMHRHSREDEYSYVLEGRVGPTSVVKWSTVKLATSFSNRVASGTHSGMQETPRRGSWRSSHRRDLNSASHG